MFSTDSRAIVAQKKHGSQVPTALTWDQNPSALRERMRVEQEGGKVATFQKDQGLPSGPPRVFFKLPNGNFQGIAMTRSLGDFGGKKSGLSSCPVVQQFPPGDTDQVLVIASDGLWDMIGNQEASHLVLKCDDPEDAASKLGMHATEQWMNDEGVVADDMTIVVAMLRVLGGEANAEGESVPLGMMVVPQPSSPGLGGCGVHRCENLCCTQYR
jgi:serine/threonine protein phosphatase PrpC